MCHEGHTVPDGHPLYWPESIGQYDDRDPYCIEHAIDLVESDADWCERCISADLTEDPIPSAEEAGIKNICAMLSAATSEDGITVFEHYAEEIGIAVMENHKTILAALRLAPPAGEVEKTLPELLDLAASYCNRDTADKLDELRNKLGKDVLSMEHWNALLDASSFFRVEAMRRERQATLHPSREAQLVEAAKEATRVLRARIPSIHPEGPNSLEEQKEYEEIGGSWSMLDRALAAYGSEVRS